MSTKTPFIKQENIFLHVYNRGINRNKIFIEQQNYEYFLKLIVKHIDKNSISIISYCLMPNHFHFLIHQKLAYGVSNFINAICNPYAKAMNKWLQREGHFFQGKFKVRHVMEEEYLILLANYIHFNPVRARIVSKPEDWEWSSFRSFIERKESLLIDMDILEEYFDSPTAYQEFVNKYNEGDGEIIKRYLIEEK